MSRPERKRLLGFALGFVGRAWCAALRESYAPFLPHFHLDKEPDDPLLFLVVDDCRQFRGLGYALSYPLLSFIASTPSPLPQQSLNHLEDVQTGHLISHLPNGTSLWLKDESHDAQDWYSAVLRPRSVVNSVVHALKSVEEYVGSVDKVRNAWELKGWEFEWKSLGGEELERGFLLVRRPLSVRFPQKTISGPGHLLLAQQPLLEAIPGNEPSLAVL